jgi:hypothetical protein
MNLNSESPLIVNTAISSPYFYAALNLIGSIHKNSPCVSWIYVWDLGLKQNECNILNKIEHVRIMKIPEFVPHWKDGYTWKIYMYNNCDSDLVFGIDAKSSVLNDLLPVYSIIDGKGVFCIGQGHNMDIQTPEAYWSEYGVEKGMYAQDEVFHAGIFGFKRRTIFEKVVDYTFEKVCKGDSLGYSQGEACRYPNGKGPIRNCKIFRQDQTVLNLSYRKFCGTPNLENINKFAHCGPEPLPETIIYNHRQFHYNFIKFIKWKLPFQQISKHFVLMRLNFRAYLKFFCKSINSC